MELNTEKMIGEKEGGIGWMTFNNPARRNAMSLDMWQGVETILDEFESDDDIKVIVMRGAGDKAFVSGADISEFKERRNNAEAAAEYARISEGARARLMGVKKPLIAMIQGYCLGGGMAVAMAADMRFATEDASLVFPRPGSASPMAMTGCTNSCIWSARRWPAKSCLRPAVFSLTKRNGSGLSIALSLSMSSKRRFARSRTRSAAMRPCRLQPPSIRSAKF